jgi:hypothetical protein
MSFLRSDALQEAVEWNLRPGVIGCRAPWPAGQHLVNYRLNQVDNAPGTPINTHLPMEFTYHALLVVLHL